MFVATLYQASLFMLVFQQHYFLIKVYTLCFLYICFLLPNILQTSPLPVLAPNPGSNGDPYAAPGPNAPLCYFFAILQT